MKQNKVESLLGLCTRSRNLVSGEFAAEGAVNEDLTNWVTALTSTYTINQSALDAIGAPTTTTAAAA